MEQHLFSKLSTQNGGAPALSLDEFHTITRYTNDEHAALMNLIDRPGKMVTHGTFIHDTGNQLYIGVDDQIKDVLGENHPYAYEIQMYKKGPQKGRPIHFTHGYFSPRDAKIPDIEELTSEQPKHLNTLLSEAHEKMLSYIILSTPLQ